MNRIRFGGIYRYAEVMALSIQQDEALSHISKQRMRVETKSAIKTRETNRDGGMEIERK